MKIIRTTIMYLFISFASVSLYAEEFDIAQLNIFDGYFNELNCRLAYTEEGNGINDGGCFYLYINKTYFTTALSLDSISLPHFQEAIYKSQEWKEVALTNNTTELNKIIPFDKDLELVAFRNYGGSWQLTPFLIEYRYAIIEVEDSIRDLLILSYRTVDEINNGEQGSFLVWDVNESLELLSNLISNEKIEQYKNDLLKKDQEADLFN